MIDWQEMKTAPRDKTVILAADIYGEYHLIYFNPNEDQGQLQSPWWSELLTRTRTAEHIFWRWAKIDPPEDRNIAIRKNAIAKLTHEEQRALGIAPMVMRYS